MATIASVQMTTAEKRAAKRKAAVKKAEEIFGTGKGSAEPVLNSLDYTPSLLNALNYYNSAVDSKVKRKWVMSYVGKRSSDFDSLPDYHFNSVGAIIRMKLRNQPLLDHDLEFIDKELARLRELAVSVAKIKAAQPVKPVQPKAPVKDKTAEAASEHIGEINGMIDEFVMFDKDVDVAAYLKSNQVPAQVIKLIPPAFARTTLELREVIKGEDAQLVEGYSNYKKVKLKKLLKIYESISEVCQQQVVTVKAVRKPTARKEKPAAVIAAKVKFMKDFPEFGIKSVHPSTIVGAVEVWIYNTKYKKLQVYRATEKLSVKGTTITGYEIAQSSAKTLRKPEEVKLYADMNRRSLTAAYKDLKTKESVINGRINEECIILKVFQ